MPLPTLTKELLVWIILILFLARFIGLDYAFCLRN
jgi:hypothetical protein